MIWGKLIGLIIFLHCQNLKREHLGMHVSHSFSTTDQAFLTIQWSTDFSPQLLIHSTFSLVFIEWKLTFLNLWLPKPFFFTSIVFFVINYWQLSIFVQLHFLVRKKGWFMPLPCEVNGWLKESQLNRQSNNNYFRC